MKKRILTILACVFMLINVFAFSACGNKELEATLAELKTKIEQQQEQLEEFQEQLEEQLEQQQEKISELEAIIEQQQEKTSELEATIEQQQEKISELEATIEQQQEKITEAEAKIEQLQEKIEELEKELVKLNLSNIQEVEVDDMVELSYWFFTSGVPNNRITLYSSIENAVFECVTYKGDFGRDIKQVTVNPNETIYWNYNAADFEQDFVDVTLKVEDNYVGYAIIKITQQESIIYTASVLKSAIFPKVDGEYQNISKTQVDVIIESAKSA